MFVLFVATVAGAKVVKGLTLVIIWNGDVLHLEAEVVQWTI